MMPLTALFGCCVGPWANDQCAANLQAASLAQHPGAANVTSVNALHWLYNAQQNFLAQGTPIKPLDERFADFKRRLDAAVAKRRRK